MTEHINRAELQHRCAMIFEIYKGMAFAGRDDQLFIEMWTPDSAADPYQFDRYEIRGDKITLYGIWAADCFINTISISFPLGLVDNLAAIGEFLRHQSERNRRKCCLIRAARV